MTRFSLAPLAAALLLAAVPARAAGTRITITATSAGTLSVAGPGGDSVTADEFDLAQTAGDADSGGDDGSTGVNRTIATQPGAPANAHGRSQAKSNPEFVSGLQGLDFNDQRFANGGNQFSVEPPDQGLCAGNGFVLESANDVLRIFDSSGNPLTPVVDLNTFYGYAPAINRHVSPLRFGPSVTDPSCLFDNATQRWFHVVLTLDRAIPTSQALAGSNHLDIAVSATADPTGAWVVYHLPVQNDGTQGTPDHGCVKPRRPPFVHGPCLGDYPHIGADANGFYITTNEFDLAGPFFHGAQIYALDKLAMAANSAAVNGVLFDTGDSSVVSFPGFTVWPAQSPAGNFDADNGGTEFFLSSTAVFQDNGFDNHLSVWSITNSASLGTANPAPALNVSIANTEGYGVPGKSFEKAGSIPLAVCQTVASCARAVGSALLATQNPETKLDSGDSRMQQVVYANGHLWGALDTGLLIDGTDVQNGIAFFVINPNSNNVLQQGYIGLAGNNVNYPTIAVTPSGRGVIAFTLVGADHYPSAAYASLDAKIGAGDIHVAAEGAGPDDGFTGYAGLVSSVRSRWGDYGAAAVDGNTIWVASEYIAQTCSFTDYIAPGTGGSHGFGTCGGTRGALGNWSTFISKLNVGP